MVFHFKVEHGQRPDLPHFHVARFILAHRHRRVRQVGHRFEERAHGCLHVIEAGSRGLELVADAADLRHHRRRVFALALQHADLLGQAVAAALQFFGLGLDLLALGFERIEGGDVELELARSQPFGDRGNVLAQELDVYHGGGCRF